MSHSVRSVGSLVSHDFRQLRSFFSVRSQFGLPRLRVALYSHDTMGLGHIRRNLLIAQSLVSSHLEREVLLITGSPEAGAFSMPSGVSCFLVPSIRKETNGEYRSRSLDLPIEDLIALRAKTIRSVLEEFRPDLFIVDKVPRGVLRELDPALEMIHASGSTRCILGLRDVLDDPTAVQREWKTAENEEAIRKYYESIFVYGDPRIYDLRREYNFTHETVSKVMFTGYMDQRPRLNWNVHHAAVSEILKDRFVLCLVGGGQDGARLAETFSLAEFPQNTRGVIVMGPFMSPDVQRRLQEVAAERSNLRVLDFLPEPAHLIQNAGRVISMGGYNTVCEILSFEKNALIVPRVVPRREQLIRAERLAHHKFLDLMSPDELTPLALTRWLRRKSSSRRGMKARIDLAGLSRVASFVRDLFSEQELAQARG